MSAAVTDPWRPNYERRAFILWVLVAGVALVTAGLGGLPAGAFHWLAWLALAMALTWVRGAARIASHHAWLRGHPLGCIAPEDFAARLPSWSGDLWLGWGFDWLPVHTQLALDLMRAGPEQFAPRDPQRMGATWLHGLGGRDQDLRTWKAVPRPWSSGRCGGTSPRVGPTGRRKPRPSWRAPATPPPVSKHWCATTASGSAAIIHRPCWTGCSGSTNTSKSISPRWSRA
ncbi:MAG: hypothetical protein JZU52_02690 [Lamprocystis purpurea]|uniref:hypothetical protein n=1 Tax=Lamprocystis purpurea TaxID=61598 RepID=UPI000477DFB7|nr:hypothetical protein [Lamprocystis purpurea]MBV5272580.1 hypothetical protein [Lamprocystis purpurea]